VVVSLGRDTRDDVTSDSHRSSALRQQRLLPIARDSSAEGRCAEGVVFGRHSRLRETSWMVAVSRGALCTSFGTSRRRQHTATRRGCCQRR
jgi:hypothetical protein